VRALWGSGGRHFPAGLKDGGWKWAVITSELCHFKPGRTQRAQTWGGGGYDGGHSSPSPGNISMGAFIRAEITEDFPSDGTASLQTFNIHGSKIKTVVFQERIFPVSKTRLPASIGEMAYRKPGEGGGGDSSKTCVILCNTLKALVSCVY